MYPIALFCFKRLDTLTACIESLKSCREAMHKDLIIFSDASRNEEEMIKVDEVRFYIKNISGFKSLRITYREENFGVDYNIIRGIQEMAQEFESFIVLEDDLVVSSQFLWFMDAGLTHFKDFDKVLTLSAFNYVKIPKNYVWDCYLAGRTNPWGWATWSHKIKEVDWDLANKERFLSNPNEMKAFNAWGSDRTRMLRRTLIGEIRAWDIRLDYYQFKKNQLTAYSCKNLVINNGFNDPLNASNTIGYNRFKTKIEKYEVDNFKFSDFLPRNELIENRYIVRNNLFNRIKTVIFKKLKIYNH
jgi:hypothetical protein